MTYPSRAEIGEKVRGCITASTPSLTLYGSFRSGNYHWDTQSGFSYSDVDLVSGIVDRIRNEDMACALSLKMKETTGHPFRVSVRPSRLHGPWLSSRERFLFSRIHTCISLAFGDLSDADFLDYNIAKYVLREVVFEDFSRRPLTASDLTPQGFSSETADALIAKKTRSFEWDPGTREDLLNELSSTRSDVRNFILGLLSQRHMQMLKEDLRQLHEKPVSPDLASDIDRRLEELAG